MVDALLIEKSDTSKEALKKLSSMVREYQSQMRSVERSQARVDVKLAAANQILERDIPDYMNEVDISAVSLADGTTVKCEGKLFGGITAKNRDKAFAWLRKNGHGDIIKNVVTATFGKGDDAAAKKLEALITKQGYGVGRKESVHHGTLQAWIREMSEKGKNVPPVTCGTFEKQIVTIGKPNNKKKGNK